MKKKPKMKSMALSILLTLAMIVGLMPGMSLTAFAGGTTLAYSGGTGTEADPYLISTVDDWKALAGAVNDGEAYADKYFRQTADLNMSGVDGLVPVGTLAEPFEGNYEGDGFAISNATINGVTTDGDTVAGVFGVLTGKGSISNLIVENATVTATQGSMAFAGGLVAVVEDAAITDCSVSRSSVTAGGGSDTFSGAVVGYAQSENGEVTTISQIASTNNTVVGGGYGGGVLGSFLNDGTLSMTNCYAVGSNVSAQTYSNAQMGAFLGNSQGGDISLTNCFVYDCSVNATRSTFGKAGLFAGDIIQEGTVSATNTYYYDTNNLPANAESATAKTADEMKSLASTLGDVFTQGSNYPILLHPVNLAVSIEGWAYGEDANEPSVTRNSSGTPTYTYADKGTTDFSATVPSNAGNYTVKATVEKTATHKAAEATADFTIAKVDAAVTTAPTAKTLTANGQAQALVTAGEAFGGEMQYAIGKDATTAPVDGYKASIPTATNAGTYYVWHKVIGDENHNDSEPVCVTVTINEPAPTAVELTVNAKTVSAKTLNATIAKAGVSADSVTTITLGKKVKKIKKGSFKNFRNANTLVVKSKKLTRARVKGSLKGSTIKKVKVHVGKKKTNKKYVRKYKRIFTKKNAGKKVKVTR